YWIAVSCWHVQYSLNGTVFYTSAKTPTYPLVVAADVRDLSSTVKNAVVVSTAIRIPTSSGTPDPTLLPVATTSQMPMTGAYNGLNVPGLAAGSYYLDPLTGVKVYKLTSSTFPTTGFSWVHDYAEGGDEVSLPYNGNTR